MVEDDTAQKPDRPKPDLDQNRTSTKPDLGPYAEVFFAAFDPKDGPPVEAGKGVGLLGYRWEGEVQVGMLRNRLLW